MNTIKYIVVHATATNPNKEPESFKHDWHYVVNRSGKVIALLPENKQIENTYPNNEDAIHIAISGGIDKFGNPSDTKNYRQEESLFEKLIEISERHQEAIVIGADLWTGNMANPAFNVREWMCSFVHKLDEFNPAA